MRAICRRIQFPHPFVKTKDKPHAHSSGTRRRAHRIDLESRIRLPLIRRLARRIQRHRRRRERIAPFQGTLSGSPARLAEWFDFHQSVARRVWKLYMYPVMWQACDGNNEEIKGMVGQAQGMAGQFMSSASFAEPELLAMDEPTLQAWLGRDELKRYQQHIDDLLRKKQHVLSAEVEAVLGLLSDPLSRIESIRGALNDMDLSFEAAQDSAGAAQALVQSTRDKLLTDSDRQTRKSTWTNYADSYLKFRNTFATAYLTSVQKQRGGRAPARLRKRPAFQAVTQQYSG